MRLPKFDDSREQIHRAAKYFQMLIEQKMIHCIENDTPDIKELLEVDYLLPYADLDVDDQNDIADSFVTE